MASFAEVAMIISRMPEEMAAALRERMGSDPEGVERDALKWGRENPEPRFPTWGEWLCEIGVNRVSGYEDGKVIYGRTRKFYEIMDDEMANRLGLKKEAKPIVKAEMNKPAGRHEKEGG